MDDSNISTDCTHLSTTATEPSSSAPTIPEEHETYDPAKFFDLLGLPRELRDHIYGFMFGEKPIRVASIHRESRYYRGDHESKGCYGMLLTNKQINGELLHALQLTVPHHFFFDMHLDANFDITSFGPKLCSREQERYLAQPRYLFILVFQQDENSRQMRSSTRSLSPTMEFFSTLTS